jgi:UDP-2,3-diacylglucosamine pyrophosphatase LpxH
MIAIISDLHLQHTDYDGIRYRSGHTVREAGVRRNVTAGAFNRFVEMIDTRVKRYGADELHLVFAGDIFELHRTPLWFMGPDNQLRPTTEFSEQADTNDPLCGKIVQIIDSIGKEASEFLEAVKSFATSSLGPNGRCKVQVHYIPGNHDRLANAWPSVRKKVREMLGVLPSDLPFPVKLDFTASGPLPDCRVRIRHGNEYDEFNFPFKVERGKSLQRYYKDYLNPCLGDFVTVEVAARLTTAFRVLHAVKLRNSGSKELRSLYQDLIEFDDVRPMSLLFEYLAFHTGSTKAGVFKYLRPVLRDMVEIVTRKPFFKKEAKRLKIWNSVLVVGLREAVKNLSSDTLLELMPRFISKAKDGPGQGPANVAQYEPGLGDEFDLVIAGHTHHPEQVAVPGSRGGDGNFYLDTGTWRSTIRSGVARKAKQRCFGRLRGYTMVLCYNDKERNDSGEDGRRFEAWTGHLAWPRKGGKAVLQAMPYDEPVPDDYLPANVMRLRFLRLRVMEIEEDYFNGAELEVYFGVDDRRQKLRRDHVFDGNVLDLSDREPIGLDPALDGEIWAYGVEVDWGRSPLNRDDPLPWAIGRLQRDSTDQFVATEGQLILRGKAGAHMILEYLVEPSPDD